ncbi:hypothetical protein ACQPV1_21720 [Clostridium neonatale]|uniref:hypothetical protein n=1 Tax=Clostridium neonatale TaxID=137838 RepID=UPI003D3482DB
MNNPFSILGLIYMIEITYLREMERVQTLPIEVKEVIKGILEILDSEYGADRDKYEDNGDYVIVVENIEEFKEIHKKTNIDVNVVVVEYVDNISCTDGKVYINSLVLCNNDYSILLIVAFDIMSENLLKQMQK